MEGLQIVPIRFTLIGLCVTSLFTSVKGFFCNIVRHRSSLFLLEADYMTSFVRDKLSHHALFDTIDLFSTYCGLKVNHDKTEILLLGNMEVSSSELGVDEISKVIKILGVYLTFNHSLFYKLNFESIEKSLRGLLKGWSWRGLTLLGKIHSVKSLAIPKILYRVALISNTKEFIKKKKLYCILLF